MENHRPDMPPKGPPHFVIPSMPQEILDSIPNKHLDIAYWNESEDQKIDIYLPNETDDPVPVVIWFHGGGFRMGWKRDGSLRDLLPVLSKGYALISVGYRKSEEARFPAMVYDAKAAIRYIRANAKQYGLDASRIAVWGGSSGAWLASFVAATNDNPAFEDKRMGNANVSSSVQALVDWCGPCGDFLAMSKEVKKYGSKHAGFDETKSPESAFLGAPVSTIPELVHLASPATHVSAQMPPVLIVHGEKDIVVPLSQSEAFRQAIIERAGEDRVEFHVHPNGGHHGDMWYHEPWLAEMCIAFLDKHLK